MFDLKRISPAAAPSALERAERYRLLNEPLEAESICRDVLDADPANRLAAITLILALTDLFEARGGAAIDEAIGLLRRLPDEYGRTYYEGVIHEREAKWRLHRREAGAEIYRCLRRALDCFGAAEKLGPEGNDEAVLRWNTCVRVLRRNPWIESAAANEHPHAVSQGDSMELALE